MVYWYYTSKMRQIPGQIVSPTNKPHTEFSFCNFVRFVLRLLMSKRFLLNYIKTDRNSMKPR